MFTHPITPIIVGAADAGFIWIEGKRGNGGKSWKIGKIGKIWKSGNFGKDGKNGKWRNSLVPSGLTKTRFDESGTMDLTNVV